MEHHPSPPPRNGSLFSLGELDAPATAALLDDLAPFPLLAAAVTAIAELCSQDPERLTDMESLSAKLELTRPAIVSRMKALAKMGFTNEEKYRYHRDRKAVSRYTLLSPRTRPALQQLPILSEQEVKDLQLRDVGVRPVSLSYDQSFDRRRPWKGDRFFALSMIAGLRLGKSGGDAHHRETRVYHGDKYFDLEVTALYGKKVASILDLRALIVVTTLIKNYVDGQVAYGQPADASGKGFAVSLRDICKAMNLEPNAGNKTSVYQQLERWHTTQFRVTRVMYGALDWAKTLFELNQGFFLVPSLDVMKTRQQVDAHITAASKGLPLPVTIPQRISLTLNPRLLSSLSEMGRTLSIHPEILQARMISESSQYNPQQPFLHLVYYWARRAVRHSAAGKSFPMELLHREMMPYVEPWVFNQTFDELMQRTALHSLHPASPYPLSRIPGYLIAYHRDAMIATFMADPEDPIVGLRSPYTREQGGMRRRVVGPGLTDDDEGGVR